MEIAWGLVGTREYIALPRRSDLAELHGLVTQGLKLHANTFGNVLRANADARDFVAAEFLF